ncbi:MAG: TetR family transcriptional regulator [Planctomycetes bacterium]|nr:TetR family transcriptional regulator [Planctomycetota bacterium]
MSPKDGDSTPTARGEEKRQLILDAALALFRDQGYEKTTMRAIAEASGVAVGNAYYYFASKEELVQEFYRELVEEHAARCAPIFAAERSFEERLRRVLTAKIELAQPFQELSAVLFRTAANPTSTLNPLSESSAPPRLESRGIFEELVEGSRKRPPRDLRAVLPDLLWLLQMGIIFFWIHDCSPKARRTHQLIDISSKLMSRSLTLLDLPGAGGVRRLVISAVRVLLER